MQLHRPKAVELQQHKSPHVSGFLQHRPFQKEQSSRSPVQGAQNTALFCWYLTSKKEPTPNKSLLQFQANNTDTHTKTKKHKKRATRGNKHVPRTPSLAQGRQRGVDLFRLLQGLPRGMAPASKTRLEPQATELGSPPPFWRPQFCRSVSFLASKLLLQSPEFAR